MGEQKVKRIEKEHSGMEVNHKNWSGADSWFLITHVGRYYFLTDNPYTVNKEDVFNRDLGGGCQYIIRNPKPEPKKWAFFWARVYEPERWLLFEPTTEAFARKDKDVIWPAKMEPDGTFIEPEWNEQT